MPELPGGEISRNSHQTRARLSSSGQQIGSVTIRSLMHPETDWLERLSGKRVGVVALIACAGMMFYGFSVGIWRSPLMGFYVAIKFPLLIFLTLLCNGLLNGLLGMLLGTGLGFRQSFFALLSSFALAALILGSLAPVTLMLALNVPAPDSGNAEISHATFLLTHTLLIAFAGVTANVHLHRMLGNRAPSRAAATATLFSWLGGNAFLGAQFSWILRPFFGSPSLEVAFLRPDPMAGNFYEAVWHMLDKATGGNPLQATCFGAIIFSLFALVFIKNQSAKRP